VSPKEARVNRESAAGFTLLELLVVVVIIGLLAGFVAPRYFGQVGKSEVATARAQLDALEKALDQYRLDVGRYPSTELGLNALLTKTAPTCARKCPSTRGASPMSTRSPARSTSSTSSRTARTASPAAPAKTPT
jgi:general secretion pathway protein G